MSISPEGTLPLVITGPEGTPEGKSPLEDAHGYMAKFNLPAGLMPMPSLHTAIFNPNKNTFKVIQEKEFDAFFGSHRVRFYKEVSGALENGVIKSLEGVKVIKALVITIPVLEIRVDQADTTTVHFHTPVLTVALKTTDFPSAKSAPAPPPTEEEASEAVPALAAA